METIAEYNNVRIPDYALSYLINNDDSGLEPDDKKVIDNYMAEFYELAELNHGHVIIDIERELYVDDNGDEQVIEPESYFTWNPAFGLACNVMDCTILVCK